MSWKLRLQLAWKILIGRYASTIAYHHPRVGVSEITLRHRTFDWSHQLEETKTEYYCTIEPRCIAYAGHSGNHQLI